MSKNSVLILCTGNSARSQMAEGLLRHEAGSRFEVFSAGTRPSIVRSEAIAVMQEIGIDISGHLSKAVDEFVGRDLNYVITVCDNARESCPVFPAKTLRMLGRSRIRLRKKDRRKSGRLHSERSGTRSTSA